MVLPTITQPKIAGDTILSADMNQIIGAVQTKAKDIGPDKVELKVQSSDPTGGELREAVIWYISNIIKYRTSSATKTIANIDDAQTFAGATTFSAGILTDTISEKTAAAGVTIDGLLIKDEYIEFDEIASPSAPAANKARLYSKDEGGITVLAYQDSAGTETLLEQSPFTRAKRTAKVFEGVFVGPDAATSSGRVGHNGNTNTARPLFVGGRTDSLEGYLPTNTILEILFVMQTRNAATTGDASVVAFGSGSSAIQIIFWNQGHSTKPNNIEVSTQRNSDGGTDTNTLSDWTDGNAELWYLKITIKANSSTAGYRIFDMDIYRGGTLVLSKTERRVQDTEPFANTIGRRSAGGDATTAPEIHVQSPPMYRLTLP